ncbi:MAG: hypothetical protein JNL74_19945 [Fibrobacteres bacterium]|nr:hypothetical protein [Fibrobacterota bacterium]
MIINPERQPIPREFIEKLPEGFKVANRHGSIYVVVEDVRCPNGHNIITDTVRLHGEPSIGIKVKGGGIKGTMYLDPFWGLHQKLFDFMFKSNIPNPLIKAACPHCNASLMTTKRCDTPGCNSDEFIEFSLPGKGNKIDVCARWGCSEHSITIESIGEDTTVQVKKINYQDMHTHGEAMGF